MWIATNQNLYLQVYNVLYVSFVRSYLQLNNLIVGSKTSFVLFCKINQVLLISQIIIDDTSYSQIVYQHRIFSQIETVNDLLLSITEIETTFCFSKETQ